VHAPTGEAEHECVCGCVCACAHMCACVFVWDEVRVCVYDVLSLVP
jgi:hypothetical protein